MLDHAFLAAVETMRRSCLLAMLDRDAGDERFQADLLGGDLTWETSFSLPGEAVDRLRAAAAKIVLESPALREALKSEQFHVAAAR